MQKLKKKSQRNETNILFLFSLGEFDDLISALRTGDVFGEDMAKMKRTRRRANAPADPSRERIGKIKCWSCHCFVDWIKTMFLNTYKTTSRLIFGWWNKTYVFPLLKFPLQWRLNFIITLPHYFSQFFFLQSKLVNEKLKNK